MKPTIFTASSATNRLYSFHLVSGMNGEVRIGSVGSDMAAPDHLRSRVALIAVEYYGGVSSMEATIFTASSAMDRIYRFPLGFVISYVPTRTWVLAAPFQIRQHHSPL